ncbi:MAG: ABC-2 family transporter protein [Lachnospiraceae bacterium]|nr:ABC-2 family transporter protein [Lachnospiraceae bacterium]MCQ2544655.1 ABC-2 family transporter protein [Lachnospiraceae bacterium]
MENTNTNVIFKRRGLAFYINIYFKIIAQDIKSKMSYRSDFIISTVGMVATNIAGFIAFLIMFGKFPSINGWGYYEILFLYGFSLISITPTQCLLDNNWSLRRYVYDGDFVKYCFRPINLWFYYVSEVFDVKGLGQLVFGFVTLIYAWIKLSLPVTFLLIIETIIALITASLFMMALQNAAAASCFWIQNSFWLLDISLKMKDYAKYPVTIFNDVFKFIFTFILPVAFMAYYPSLAILRPDDVPLLTWLSPVIGILAFYASYKLWMKGASKYDGSGS